MTRRIPPALRLVAVTALALLVLQVAEAKGCGGNGEDAAQPGAVVAGLAAAPPAAAAPVDDAWRAGLLKAGVLEADLDGPHPIKADIANPDQRVAQPALGGRVIMHMPSQPPSLCYPIGNSAVTTWVLYELHASLIKLNWETRQYDLLLARACEREDTLILKGGRSADNGNIRYGTVTEQGDDYVVTSGSPNNPIAETRVPKSDVASLERDTVFTFHLRDDVKWHDGHPFDANDVFFSWDIYNNPNVDCDEVRYRFKEIVKAEVLDKYTIRFFYRQQYFQAYQSFDDSFCILPSHLYNLLDKENPDYNPKATLEEQGTYINKNPHNFDWVGLGPYKLKKWEQNQYIEAEKFADYFEKDPAKSGYLDTMMWRFIQDDNVALQALLNHEVDIFYRVKTEDYFGDVTAQKVFTDSFYKVYNYTGNCGYIAWNMYRDKLKDPNVRTALAYGFDADDWIATKYKGLAVRITSTAYFLGPAYNFDVEPIPYDPDKAEELLTEAGWYDRDGDGIVDKDGQPLTIEFLMPSGNKASETFLQKLQAGYKKIGVGVTIQPLEWASFQEKMKNRDFDALNQAWVLNELESDPKQLWYSTEGAFEMRSGNICGYQDPESDRLIDAGRRELDPAKRYALWKQLDARIYGLQPYIFCQNAATKYAFNKQLRGVKLYIFMPGFRLRDMYYEEGTPGTRPLSRN